MDRAGRGTLAVIVVSANSAHWLEACLSSVLEKAGDIDLDLVVVDSGSTDGTQALVAERYPMARLVATENHGFAYANNRALETVGAEWILFLNPDTQLLSGTLSELVDEIRKRPKVGVVAVRQVTADGQVFPTIRRFPNAGRSFLEALGSERFPVRASWLGERELDLAVYDTEVACDWTTGAFMLLRREALLSAGFMDERFFLYSEETDLCRRVKQAGWEIRHLPLMTIVHHANKAGWNVQLEAQSAYSRRQYMAKHFSPAHRASGTAAVAFGYALRALLPGRSDETRRRRACARAALATVLGARPAPFEEPPQHAVSSARDG